MTKKLFKILIVIILVAISLKLIDICLSCMSYPSDLEVLLGLIGLPIILFLNILTFKKLFKANKK